MAAMQKRQPPNCHSPKITGLLFFSHFPSFLSLSLTQTMHSLPPLHLFSPIYFCYASSPPLSPPQPSSSLTLFVHLCLFTSSLSPYHHLYVSLLDHVQYPPRRPCGPKACSLSTNNLAQCDRSVMGCGSADTKEEGPRAPKE